MDIRVRKNGKYIEIIIYDMDGEKISFGYLEKEEARKISEDLLRAALEIIDI